MLQKLHFRRTWFVLGVVLLLIIIVGSLVPIPKTGVQANDKLIHISMYLILMTWFAQIFEVRFHLRIAISFVSLGLLLEAAQGATGYRSFEWLDALANSAGVVIGWVLAHTILGKALFSVDTRLARLLSRDG